mgnify:CR=1 FL=1
MITLDKLVIRLNRFSHNLLIHFVFWYGSFFFFYFLTGHQNIFLRQLNLMHTPDLYVSILVLSGTLSLLFVLVDGVLAAPPVRLLPRKFLIFLKSLICFVSIFILMILADPLAMQKLIGGELKSAVSRIPLMDIPMIRFLVYFYLSIILIHLLKGAISKVGKRNFRSWLLGMLNKPLEQERLFLFIDMKSSTSIAEQLDHKKFSRLVRDVFNDLEVVGNYQGEIYQYLGDGAIVVWNIKEGLSGNNFLRAYYAFKKVIHRRRSYYTRKYGQQPVFKAGAHAGRVMVLQVGQDRRDISYNGDTINTAARIESQCNKLKQEVLISGALYNRISGRKGFQFKHAGNVKLNGKKKSIELYGVKKSS